MAGHHAVQKFCYGTKLFPEYLLLFYTWFCFVYDLYEQWLHLKLPFSWQGSLEAKTFV